MKFLVTGANGDIALSILEILKRNFKNCIVHGSEIKPEGKGKFFFQKIIKVPKSSDYNFITCFAKLSREYHLIIPTTELEIKKFSQNLIKIKNKNILINNQQIIRIFMDKLKTYKFLKKHNIGCPSFTDDFKNWKKYKFPMFIKKKTGAGNKGYIVARSENDFKPILADKNLIIQEYLHSTKEYSACIYSNNNCNTRILIFERELDKDRTLYAKYIKDINLEYQIKKILSVIKLKGSINIQFKVINKKIKIFEINPRLSSTVNMRDLINFKDCVWWILDFLNLKNINKKNLIKKNTELLRYEKIRIIN
jgi:carbamoyl-phosphate synthase large subunit